MVLCGQHIQELVWRGGAGLLRHGYTYSGHATGAAVALANLDLIDAENLLARVQELEGVLESTFALLEPPFSR